MRVVTGINIIIRARALERKREREREIWKNTHGPERKRERERKRDEKNRRYALLFFSELPH